MNRIVFAACMSILLTACYEDKGNYDYRFSQMNEMKSFQFTPATYDGIEGTTIEFQQPIGEAKTERIIVDVSQSLFDNLNNIDFLWRVSKNVEGEEQIDSFNTQGYLDLLLEAGKESRFKVMLTTTDRTTSLKKYQQFIVKTRPIYQNSLFVLHGNVAGGMQLGNIEELGSQTIVRMNAYKTVFPDAAVNPYAYGVGLGYTVAFDYRSRRESNSLCVFNQDGTSVVYDPYGLKTKFPNGYALPQNAKEPFVYHNLVVTGSVMNNTDRRLLIAQDGRYYLAGSYLCFHEPAGVAEQKTDYQISAATITDSHYLMWDKLHSRFLYQSKNEYFGYDEGNAREAQMFNYAYDALIDYSHLPNGISPEGKEAIYAYVPYAENFEEAPAYFVFRDNATQCYYLYQLTSLISKDKKTNRLRGDDDGGEFIEGSAYSITAQTMPNFNPDNPITALAYNAWFTPNYLFYSEGGIVYRYNTSNGEKAIIYTAPEGYQISVLKFRSTEIGGLSGDLGRYLSIGMNRGGEGAVAEIKLTTAADLDEEFKTRFYNHDNQGNKFGRIVDLQFANVYAYQLPTVQ